MTRIKTVRDRAEHPVLFLIHPKDNEGKSVVFGYSDKLYDTDEAGRILNQLRRAENKARGRGHAIGRGRPQTEPLPTPHIAKPKVVKSASLSEFSYIPLPSNKAQQLEAVKQAGLKPGQVKFDRDERNAFAKKSGAYMGEVLPPGGDGVVESYKYPILKASGLAQAKLREPPAPIFSDSGAYIGEGLKKKLGKRKGKGSEVGWEGEARESRYNGVPYPG